MSRGNRVRLLALLLSFILALDFGAVRAFATQDETETEAETVREDMSAIGAASFADADMFAAQETIDALSPEKEVVIQFAPGIDTSFYMDGSFAAPVTAADLRREMEQVAEMTQEERETHDLQYSLVGTIAIAKTSLALNIRADADSDAKIVGKLYQGSGAVYGGVKGNWTYVTSGDVSGWAASRYVLTGDAAKAVYDEMDPQVATPTTDGLSVRKEASTESDLMTKVNRDEHYPVLGIEGNWVLIQISSHEQGYVSAEYVSVTKGLCTAKTAAQDEAVEEDIARIEAERQAAIEAAREAARKEKEKQSSSSSSGSSSSSSSSSGSSGSSSSSSGSSGSSGSSSSSSGSSGSSSSSSGSSGSSSEGSGSMKGWTKVGTCRLSSYCARCNSPAGHATYTGVKAKEWKTVAVDPDIIPLGSQVYIEGYGYFKAQDIGVNGKWIDLFVNSDECHIWDKATVWYK